MGGQGNCHISFHLFFVPLYCGLFIVGKGEGCGVFVRSQFCPKGRASHGTDPPGNMYHSRFNGNQDMLTSKRTCHKTKTTKREPYQLQRTIIRVTLRETCNKIQREIFHSYVVSLSLFLPSLPQGVVCAIRGVIVITLRTTTRHFRYQDTYVMSRENHQTSIRLPRPQPRCQLTMLQATTALTTRECDEN